MKFFKQIQYNFSEINWGNPITQGLQFCYNSDALGDIDLVRRINPITRKTASVNRYSSKYGYTDSSGIVFSPESTYHLDITSGPLSVFACGWFGTLVDNSIFLSRINYTSESVNTGWSLQLDTAASGNIKFINGNNNATTTAGGFVLFGAGAVANSRYSILATENGSNSKVLYVNGKLVTTIATGNMTSLTAPTATVVVGGTTSNYVNLTMIWNRQLSAAEASALYENPHQIFKSKQKYVSRLAYSTSARSASVSSTLLATTSAANVIHQSSPSVTVSKTLGTLTSKSTAFFNQTNYFKILNQSYDTTNGNSFSQISDGSITPLLYNGYYVGKSAVIGYGLAQAVDYDTSVLVQTPDLIIDQKLFYDKSDIIPIVTGGTFTF